VLAPTGGARTSLLTNRVRSRPWAVLGSRELQVKESESTMQVEYFAAQRAEKKWDLNA